MKKVFYSWQSDSPSSTNRAFIEKALKKAITVITSDEVVAVTPEIDQATRGTPGSPDIAGTILQKIDDCWAFVCDVSIVGQTSAAKGTPNPNVLFELGYALRAHGDSRIIMVQNVAEEGPEELPFDLRKRRVLTYRQPSDRSRQVERDALAKALARALRSILESAEKTAAEQHDRIRRIEDEIRDLGNWANQAATMKAVEGLRRLNREGVSEIRLHRTYLQGAPLQEVKLSGAFLWEVDLRDANLFSADLRGAFLGGADLRGACLVGAQLQSAELIGARLERANFRDANLDGAQFTYSNLREARNLTAEQLSHCSNCFNAQLDPTLLQEMRENYQHLLYFPKEVQEVLANATAHMRPNGFHP